MLCSAPAAQAQAAGQVWGSVIVSWLATERVSYRVELEPKSQPIVHDGKPTWTSFDAIPRVEYTLARWIDALAELDIGRRDQSDDVDQVTVTPRVGAQLYILSRVLLPHGRTGPEREKLPRRRLEFNSLLRLENESTFYSTEAPAKSQWILRDRFEVAYPLNRMKTTDDGAVYVIADNELFIPFDDAPAGHLVSEVRIRSGLGYRQSFGWRFEGLYIWTGERNAESGALAAQSHAIDIRVYRRF